MDANKKHIIYKATSPSGKVYIGKTSIPLKHRIISHRYDAFIRNKTYAFSSAIRKYDSAIIWETLKKDISTQDIDTAEKEYIAQYRSNNPLYGYNLTSGGDGGLQNPDSILKKSASLKHHYLSPQGELTKATLANKSKEMRASEIGRLIDKKVKSTRSSAASRAKTSNILRTRYSNPSEREKLAAVNKEKYKDPNLRLKVAMAVRAARAKPFIVYNMDNTIVGRWDNATTCAEHYPYLEMRYLRA